MYLCHGCGRSFSSRSVSSLARLRRPEARRRFRALMDRGLSLRAIARALGIGVGTAWRWRHEELARMAEQQRCHRSLLRGRVVVDALPFDGRRACWGQEPNFYWEAHVAPRLPRNRPASPPVTLAFAVQVTPAGRPAAPGAVACAVVPGALTRLTLTRAVAGCVAPGSWVETQRGAAEVRPGGRSVRVRWRTWDGAGGCPARVLDLTPARCLRVMFTRWMRRFRGVATAYLARYAAWFIHTIRQDRGMQEEWLRAAGRHHAA